MSYLCGEHAKFMYLDIICSSYFCGYALRLYCKDIGAITHMGYYNYVITWTWRFVRR
nr:MAG TPA: hypothetical protein [Caudoviricetes sp.]